VNPVKRAWFADKNFRQAISHSINRDALVQNAFYGKAVPAFGMESVSNKQWYNDAIAKYPYDLDKAKALLQQSGFVLKGEPGAPKLYDKRGNEVRFTLNTNAGNTLRNTECNLITSDLAKIGIQVEYTPLDFNSLITKIDQTFDYDAMLMALNHDDLDPNGGLNVWMSSGSLHFWWPRQKTPATPWEKRIDELLTQQSSMFDFAERKKAYDEVQAIIAEQQPMIFTVTQKIFVCGRDNLGNFSPTLARHRTLWNAAELYWK
jgi:peptide/nickel transport system substrate-binding protein